MNPWKHLLPKIFSDAQTAPEAPQVPDVTEGDSPALAMPAEKPAGPVERIHAMRQIKSGGFARLYGAKDVAQFSRQIEYMRDFDDACPQAEIPFSDPMPTYADMSVAQLRCYFTWRAQTRRGVWEGIPFSYALLYLFELLNAPGAARQLAQGWLALRAFHPRLDARMQRWFKDYYICYGGAVPFRQLAEELGLAPFFPQEPRRSLLSLSSYAWQDSRFFREFPEMQPVLEQALDAALRNLGPLFTLYGLTPEGIFDPRPARFLHYEPFGEAAVLLPVSQENREVRISQNEIYRLRAGTWSCAREDAFCPPSHGLGYLVKRIEAEMRAFAGFSAPWNADARPLLERWLHSDLAAQDLLAFLEDSRFDAILSATVRTVCGGALPEGALVAQAADLAAQLGSEPLRTILRLREIPGGLAGSPKAARQFKKQARLLAPLSDAYGEMAPYASKTPVYAEMTPQMLRTYLTWRTRLRTGNLRKTDTSYALLYCYELLCGIEKEPLPKLCAFLRAYAPLDRAVEKKLPAWLLDYYVTQPQAPDDDFPALLRRCGLECYFPALFLFGPGPQLPLFRQFASYNLAKSRFYRTEHDALFLDCFKQVLAAAEEFYHVAHMELRRAFLEPPRHGEGWQPFQGTPVSIPTSKQPRAVAFAGEKYAYDGRAWRCAARTELSPFAGPLAGFLIKRMEMRLRQAARFPYPLTADPAQMLGKALPHRGKLRALLGVAQSEEFLRALDAAVEAFAQTHDLSGLRGQETGGRRRAPLPPDSSPLPPVSVVRVDFSKLPQIRREAREMTERLIVEESEELTMNNEQLTIMNECPVIGQMSVVPSSLREALSPAQIAIVEYLIAGEGAPPPMDELALEGINEAALEVLGDTLIDVLEDVPYVYEEYVSKWKEGGL